MPTTASLQSLWERRPAGATSLEVLRTCYDGDGYIVSSEPSTWAPAAAGGPPPPLIDPAVLAAAARSRLAFPAPLPRSQPALETGTFAQHPTSFWVDGWVPASASATAGPVTATVTATPVSQEWEIRDGFRGVSDSIVCRGAGAVAAGGASDGPGADACEWTPAHSSAGQVTTGGDGDEPCFSATVTVTWDVGWTANVPGAGGALGAGTSSTDVCLIVAEVQAVMADAG